MKNKPTLRYIVHTAFPFGKKRNAYHLSLTGGIMVPLRVAYAKLLIKKLRLQHRPKLDTSTWGIKQSFYTPNRK